MDVLRLHTKKDFALASLPAKDSMNPQKKASAIACCRRTERFERRKEKKRERGGGGPRERQRRGPGKTALEFRQKKKGKRGGRLRTSAAKGKGECRGTVIRSGRTAAAREKEKGGKPNDRRRRERKSAKKGSTSTSSRTSKKGKWDVWPPATDAPPPRQNGEARSRRGGKTRKCFCGSYGGNFFRARARRGGKKIQDLLWYEAGKGEGKANRTFDLVVSKKAALPTAKKGCFSCTGEEGRKEVTPSSSSGFRKPVSNASLAGWEEKGQRSCPPKEKEKQQQKKQKGRKGSENAFWADRERNGKRRIDTGGVPTTGTKDEGRGNGNRRLPEKGGGEGGPTFLFLKRLA